MTSEIQLNHIDKSFEICWMKSYNEFTNWVNLYGLPDAISFNHDLADEQLFEKKQVMTMLNIL